MFKMRKNICLFLGIVLALSLVAGCKAEEEKKIVIDKEEKTSSYRLTEVIQQDVVSSKKLTLTFSSKASENLSFGIDGYRIKEVYVNQGAHVNKGDLLAELDMEDISDELDSIKTQLADLEVEERYTKERRDLELDQASRMLASGETDEEGYKELLAGIGEKYDAEIKKLEDLIYYYNRRFVHYDTQVEAGRIYAGIDGTAIYVRPYSSGSRSSSGQTAVTIYDTDRCIFTCKDVEYADYLIDGANYTITLLSGKPTETVFHLSEDGKALEFELVEPNYRLSASSKATINIELQRSDNAVAVLKRAVHSADGKHYVYYLDENDIRKVQYVEVGLLGDEYYELISGVKVGDRVVLK